MEKREGGVMDYSKMSDAEINVEVSKHEYPDAEKNTPYYHRPDVYIYHRNGTHEAKDYCNNPADSWPIIEVSEIGIVKSPNGWCATNDDAKFEGVYFIDKKPLRAAMIVFLMMQERRNA